MKLCNVFYIFLFFYSFSAEAILINIKKVDVLCGSSPKCLAYKEKFKNFVAYKGKSEELVQKIKLAIIDGDISDFYFSIERTAAGDELQVNFEVKQVIEQIEIISEEDFDSLLDLLPIKKLDYYKKDKLDRIKPVISKYLKERGYYNPSITIKVVNNEYKYKILLEIEPGVVERLKVGSIKLPKIKQIQKTLTIKSKSLNDEPYSLPLLKEYLEETKNFLASNGYYFSIVSYTTKRIGENLHRIDFEIKPEIKISFSIRGNKIFTRQEIKSDILRIIRSANKEIPAAPFIAAIQEKYKEIGIYNTVVKDSMVSSKSRDGFISKTFDFNIIEGKKIPIEKLKFIGNKFFDDEKVLEIFQDKGPVLTGRDFFEEDYIQSFPSILKKEYYEKGYVLAKVSRPFQSFRKKNREVFIEYRIQEGVQSILDDVIIDIPDLALKEEIISKLTNKEQNPININEIENDLNIALEIARAYGYYYANLPEVPASTIAQYSSNFRSSKLVIPLTLGPKIKYGDYFISGIEKTQAIVIKREINFKKGDIVTPFRINDFKTRLSSLGVFSNVKVIPVRSKNDPDVINLLVRVREKNYGIIEVAPGFRTDIGLKISTSVNYNNLWGLNRGVAFKGQVNQRLDFDTLDSRRRAERIRRLEYKANVNYTEPWLFGHPLKFTTGFENSRRRFFSFDADIFKFTTVFSKEFNKYFFMSLRYQLEAITQFDATDKVNDEGFFRIGGLTPTLNLDFRDDDIRPRKGALFSLSNEFANPTFFSLDRDDFEINYFKLISRNTFYYPIGPSTTALSISIGWQKNLNDDPLLNKNGVQQINSNGVPSTVGKIPSIKTFRLNGIDLVRGFDDNEANYLNDQQRDISDVVLQSEAYFTNVKLEQRFPITDNLTYAFFVDAGSVQVDHFKPFAVRSSAGISFKIVTPVGSLDFDYGFKLHRKRINGKLESPGRFHLSLGYF